MNKLKLKTNELTKIALLVSLLCVSVYISVPLGFTPIPATMQSLVICVIALILKPKSSFICVFIYILTGVIGFPVFSGFSGGPARLFGPTGGYILAFLIFIPLVSYLKKYFLRLEKGIFKKRSRATKVFVYTLNTFFVGMTGIYITGSIYLSFIMSVSFKEALVMGVLPYVIFDLIKCGVASLLSVYINKD